MIEHLVTHTGCTAETATVALIATDYNLTAAALLIIGA